MKPAITIIGAALLASITSLAPDTTAEHGSPLLLVKPGDGATIPRNAQIRLVSYNGEDELIWLLGRQPHEARARLVADGGAVPLKPGRYFTDHDGYGRAMVSLVPARLLAPDTTYRLVVDVPSAGWSEQLASFTTSDEVDRTAPRWRTPPVHETAENALVGRLTEYEDLIELEVIARPRAGGRARRTFVLFDLAQQCIEGPTADYNVAIFNSQCIPEEEQQRRGAICDTLYYFPPWRPEGTLYDVTIDLRDLAGNLRRIHRPAARIEIGEPFGLCLEM